jgi:hypothetical protein
MTYKEYQKAALVSQYDIIGAVIAARIEKQRT